MSDTKPPKVPPTTPDPDRPTLTSFFVIEGLKWGGVLVIAIVLFSFIWSLIERFLNTLAEGGPPLQ